MGLSGLLRWVREPVDSLRLDFTEILESLKIDNIDASTSFRESALVF